MRHVKVALCQMNSREDVEENIHAAMALLDQAVTGGADLAALPEVWPCQGSARVVRRAAEPIPGPVSERLAGFAQRNRIWVHAGSLIEAADDRIYDTSVLFDRNGTEVARYRKIHLFDVDLPGQPPIRESSVYAPGEQVVTAETEFGRVGLAICYDLRFPELFRALVARGSEIVFVPAAFHWETGTDHWEVLVRARAIEDQVFVIAAGQWGTWGPSEHGRRNFGDSMVVDPWGRVIARAPDGVGVAFADLDLDEVRRVRERLPALRHRRLNLTC